MSVFGTKAETLSALDQYGSTFVIPAFDYCVYSDWVENKYNIADEIARKFSGSLLAVRSSALIEDTETSSMAGAFCSELHVNAERAELISSIDRVFASYGSSIAAGDQVLVQIMVADVAISGVAMTHNLQDGAPYYIISYDDVSGRTDTVTAGNYPHKTVIIHRSCADLSVKSPRIRSVLRLVRDVESIVGPKPMDIEFAVDSQGVTYLLQVRPIAAETNWQANLSFAVNAALNQAEHHLDSLAEPQHGLFGSATILANMPDWNPAEMIHPVPRPLAASLYRFLITDFVWADARRDMGYHDVRTTELMRGIAGHVYIDVRASLNSLLPSGLSEDAATRLVDASISRLNSNPHLHDKLEFELAVTIFTPTFEADFNRIYGEIDDATKVEFKARLLEVTKNLLSNEEEGSLTKAENSIHALEGLQRSRNICNSLEGVASRDLIVRVRSLLIECIDLGSKPFAILARHGFIAQSLLKSLVEVGAITEGRKNELMASISTIASDMSEMLSNIHSHDESIDEFIKRFGHLRPGTYDIETYRYADQIELFTEKKPKVFSGAKKKNFILTSDEVERVQKALSDIDIDVDRFGAEELVCYIRRATKCREWAKLVFTKNLSDVLELIIEWGARFGLSREDMSFVDVRILLDQLTAINEPLRGADLRGVLEASRSQWYVHRSVALPHIIKERNDLFVVPLQRTMPNFIASSKISAPIAVLEGGAATGVEIAGKIVCIQSADPGFDWIFTRGIAGLVTLHGGPNSHMAIRCAEFSLPAAIGVGEELFARICLAEEIELNCLDRRIEVL